MMYKNVPFNSSIAFGLVIANTLLLLFLLTGFKDLDENRIFELLVFFPFIIAVQTGFISYFESHSGIAKFYKYITIIAFIISILAFAFIQYANALAKAYLH